MIYLMVDVFGAGQNHPKHLVVERLSIKTCCLFVRKNYQEIGI